MSINSFEEGSECSGLLLQLVGSNKIWKEKWFVVNDGKMLCYADKKAKKPDETISLRDVHVRISPQFYPAYCCFELVAPNTIYYFVSQTPKQMTRWMNHVKRHSMLTHENDLIEKAEDLIRSTESQMCNLETATAQNDHHMRMKYFQFLNLQQQQANSSYNNRSSARLAVQQNLQYQQQQQQQQQFYHHHHSLQRHYHSESDLMSICSLNSNNNEDYRSDDGSDDIDASSTTTTTT